MMILTAASQVCAANSIDGINGGLEFLRSYYLNMQCFFEYSSKLKEIFHKRINLAY
jgi:hypothetical protein